MRLPAYSRRLSGKELGERLNFTNAEREMIRAWRIAPIDMTANELAEQRKAKDRARKEAMRRQTGSRPQANSLTKRKPWEAEGISRRKWYRRRGTGCSATILIKARNKLCHASTKPKRPKLARGNLCSPQNQNGKGQRMTKDPFSPRPSSTTEQPASSSTTEQPASLELDHLDWANMSEDQVTATIAAMEREHWARAPASMRRGGQRKRQRRRHG